MRSDVREPDAGMAGIREGVGNVATQAIPREQWSSFFDRFSDTYAGRSATLEVFGIDIGDQTIAGEQVFRGISADLKDGENRIALQMGPLVDEGTTHSVSEPVEVWHNDGTDATEASLEIRSADGSSVLLHFVGATLPA
jgi:hypothetical protein